MSLSLTSSEDNWQAKSYDELMDEAVHLEVTHQGLSGPQAASVRTKFESLVMTCSFTARPEYAEFNEFAPRLHHMCLEHPVHPAALDAFLRAAWKACDEEAKGTRQIPGKAEVLARAREFRRSMILDTEQSWAYEGLNVQFRSDLENGEDPVEVVKSYGKPIASNLAEMSELMREYIDSGGLDASAAKAVAEFERTYGKGKKEP